jgi:hypothetical protein
MADTEDGYKLTELEIIVSVNRDDARDEFTAIAEATRHLSEHSQNFAVNTVIWSVDTYGGGDDDWGVGIHVDYIYTADNDLRDLMNELVDTPNVETVEKSG